MINGVVAHRLPHDEVEAVMRGDGRALYVWGTVDYEDVFGSRWRTHFCQIYNFILDAEGKSVKVQSRYHNLHNNMT